MRHNGEYVGFNLYRWNVLKSDWDLFWNSQNGLDKTPYTQEANPHSFIVLSIAKPEFNLGFHSNCPNASTCQNRATAIQAIGAVRTTGMAH